MVNRPILIKYGHVNTTPSFGLQRDVLFHVGNNTLGILRVTRRVGRCKTSTTARNDHGTHRLRIGSAQHTTLSASLFDTCDESLHRAKRRRVPRRFGKLVPLRVSACFLYLEVYDGTMLIRGPPRSTRSSQEELDRRELPHSTAYKINNTFS